MLLESEINEQIQLSDKMTDLIIPSSGENLPQETGIGKTNLKFSC